MRAFPTVLPAPGAAGVYSMQGAVPGSTAGAGSAANPWLLYANTRFSTTNFGGVINTGPLTNLWFSQNGVLAPFDHGQPTGSGSAQIGGDGGYFTNTSAFAAQKMDQVFGRFDYDFTDDIKGYVELAATTVVDIAGNSNTQIATKAIGYNNAYLATIQPQYRALLPASLQSGAGAIGTINAAGSFNFSEVFNQPDAFPGAQIGEPRHQHHVLSGLSGSLGDYKWDLGYEHAQEKTANFQPNNFSNPRLYAALNAVVNPANGQIVCNAALVNPAVYGGCVPLNLFGPSAMNSRGVRLDQEPVDRHHHATAWTISPPASAARRSALGRSGQHGAVGRMAPSDLWRRQHGAADRSGQLHRHPVQLHRRPGALCQLDGEFPHRRRWT